MSLRKLVDVCALAHCRFLARNGDRSTAFQRYGVMALANGPAIPRPRNGPRTVTRKAEDLGDWR